MKAHLSLFIFLGEGAARNGGAYRLISNAYTKLVLLLGRVADKD